ncbi:sugar phosphate isomerase/epimerase [Opitutales bacterium ASA1]|uniref:TIM barrel protein n=1 Tax=Congregicoccus parvus TaxID=3081749 RepID=UPI002B2BB90C|nr:sugar phosphate isomerase/epimerase [Opitutales bacterium ASA1]
MLAYVNDELPVLGAALKLSTLRRRVVWIIENQRDLELQDPCLPEVLEGDWKVQAREICTMLDGHRGRRGVHAPYDGVHVATPHSSLAVAVRDTLLRALEFAAAVGGTHLVLHSPFLFFGTAQGAHSAAEVSAAIERTHRNLAAVLEAAAAQQTALVFENIFDLRPDPIDALVRSFDSPWVRRSLDAGHANLMRTRGGPPADRWVESSGDLLAHVHLADNDGESDRHWAAGEGTINWRSFFFALDQVKPRPRLILEMSPERQDASVRWLSERGLAR